MAIGRELDDRGITTPAAIGEALGMPAAEATNLLTRHQWREGDVARLQAAAAREPLPTGDMPKAMDTRGRHGPAVAKPDLQGWCSSRRAS